MKQLVKKMTSKMGAIVAAFLFVSSFALVAAPTAFAQQCDTSQLNITSGVACGQPDGTPTELVGSQDSVFKKITNVMLFLVGAISVIMLIVGGIRYTISGGDQGAVQSAKNTIMYAIVGIIVSILAFAVVSFVTSKLVAQ